MRSCLVYLFAVSQRRFLAILEKILGRVIKFAFYMSTGNFYGNSKLFRKIAAFLSLFSEFQRKETRILTKSQHGCKGSIVSVQRKFLWTFFFKYKVSLKIIFGLEPRISSFWDFSDSFGRFVKPAFYVSIGSFEDQFFFTKMDFFLHVFGIPEEKFWSFSWLLIGRAVTIAIYLPRGVL